ncbi:MAG: isopentenyl phosphate kinase [Nitrososphaeria archaeon]
MDGVVESVVIKLGGSVITYKDRPMTFRSGAVDALSKVLSSHPSKKIIVHGGGSFGHYFAKKAGLSTECKPTDRLKEVFLIRQSMFALNQHVVSSLSKNGVYPYIIAPYPLLENPASTKIFLARLMDHGLVPLLFGDIIPCLEGFKILSGDDISYHVCSMIKPTRMIFCMDVDGIYPSPKIEGEVIRELGGEFLKDVVGDTKKFDVTGGVARKLKVASKISKLGTDVFFVNGLKPDSFLKALNGIVGVGTYMRGIK